MDKINDHDLACEGISHIINNEWNKCEELFNKHREYSPLMNYCSTFFQFIKAIMSFEDHLLDQASKNLEITERLCSNNNKMLSSMKKLFGISKSNSSNSSLHQKFINECNSLEDRFLKQIIIADCKLFGAILSFIRQDYSGVLQLRSSWKIYSRIHTNLFELFKKLEPRAEELYGIDPSKLETIFMEENDDVKNNNIDENSDDDLDSQVLDNIKLESVIRLLGAVCFGYGIFQIAISFLPPNVLKLIKILGFESDRVAALKAIKFTSQSKDMRAPFADMVLLWYETMAKPLFGMSDIDVALKENEVEEVLAKNLQKYPKSSLFLYHKGKYNRSIKRDLNQSIKDYEESVECAVNTREIQLISIYELGWVYLMKLDYEKALEYFKRLSEESKWSKSFHMYVCSLLFGCLEKFTEANEAVKDGLKLVTKKSNPVEVFAQKRLEFFKKQTLKNKEICELMIIELNFLWVCLPFCEQSVLQRMLNICDFINDKNFLSIKCLFEGALNVCLGNEDLAEQVSA